MTLTASPTPVLADSAPASRAPATTATRMNRMKITPNTCQPLPRTSERLLKLLGRRNGDVHGSRPVAGGFVHGPQTIEQERVARADPERGLQHVDPDAKAVLGRLHQQCDALVIPLGEGEQSLGRVHYFGVTLLLVGAHQNFKRLGFHYAVGILCQKRFQAADLCRGIFLLDRSYVSVVLGGVLNDRSLRG